MTGNEIVILGKVFSEIDGGCSNCIISATDDLFQEMNFSLEQKMLFVESLNKNVAFSEYQLNGKEELEEASWAKQTSTNT